MEKEDNSSKRKDISTWFDQKYRIDRKSQVIPALKKTSKITQRETPAIPFQNETFEEFQPENPVVAQVSSELKFEDENDLEEKDRVKPEVQIDHILPENNLIIPPETEQLNTTSANSPEVNIHDTLEQIIFNKRELTSLKTTINAFIGGEVSAKELKKLVISSYIRIFEDIDKFISFFLAQEAKKLGGGYISTQKEQGEKDMLLDHLALRINNIYEGLKERPEILMGEPITSGHEELAIVPPESHNKIEESIPTEIIDTKPVDENQIIYIDERPYKSGECYFVIDGANIALFSSNKEKKGKIDNLYLLNDKLSSLGIKRFKVISDRSLYHNIDNQDDYLELLKTDNYEETPGGARADEFILQYAQLKDGFIITNDLFRDHYSRFGKEWIKKRHIAFSIIEDVLFFNKLYANAS